MANNINIEISGNDCKSSIINNSTGAIISKNKKLQVYGVGVWKEYKVVGTMPVDLNGTMPDELMYINEFDIVNGQPTKLLLTQNKKLGVFWYNTKEFEVIKYYYQNLLTSLLPIGVPATPGVGHVPSTFYNTITQKNENVVKAYIKSGGEEGITLTSVIYIPSATAPFVQEMNLEFKYKHFIYIYDEAGHMHQIVNFIDGNDIFTGVMSQVPNFQYGTDMPSGLTLEPTNKSIYVSKSDISSWLNNNIPAKLLY